MRLAAVVILGALLPHGLTRAEVISRRGMSAKDYQLWIKEVAEKNLLPLHVSAHTAGGRPLFSAVAGPNPAGLPWLARHGLSERDYQRLFAGKETAGHRLVSACAYLEGKQVRYLGVWVKDDQAIDWAARHDVPLKSVAGAVAEARKQGLRPDAISAVRAGGAARYLLRSVGDDGAAWVARHGLRRAEYVKLLADYGPKKYRPARASAFDDGGAPRFNVVLVQDASRPSEARHDLTGRELDKATAAAAKRGLRLASVTGYRGGNGIRYLALWRGDVALPASGKAVPALAPLEEAMRRYMREHDVACGALAVMKGGKLLLSRGYGYARRDGSRKVGPGDPFRLASVSKPITAAAARALVKAGKVKFDTPAFGLLGTKPPAGQKVDERLKAVTVRHLLEHKGGWDSGAGPLYDVMFQPGRVARGLKKSLPVTADDFVRFMAGQPLQFDPGSKEAYSNFGYCVLGRVIEKASGMSYEAYVRKTIAAPLGIKTLRVGRSLPGKRQPGEPHYRDLAAGLNLQTGKGRVPFPDGGYLIEAMDAHGGLVGSAPDVARFFDAYLMDGRPRNGGLALGTFFGSLPGTYAMARQWLDGTVVVALFNQRVNPDGRKPGRIEKLMGDAVKAVKKWP